MGRLETISEAQLAEALATVEGKRPTLRVVVGINYKQGIAQTTLADWYGVSRTTIHNWLRRLERLDTAPLEEVLYDDERPGRPPKLEPAERRAVAAVLQKRPDECGLDADQWSPRLLQAYIAARFDVEYSRRHARTVLEDLGGARPPDVAPPRDRAGQDEPDAAI